MSVKHMLFGGQSFPDDPYAVFPPFPFPHSVSAEHVSLATSYPPTIFGPQNDVCPGVRFGRMLSQSLSAGAVGSGVGYLVGGGVAGMGGDTVGSAVGFLVGDGVAGTGRGMTAIASTGMAEGVNVGGKVVPSQ